MLTVYPEITLTDLKSAWKRKYWRETQRKYLSNPEIYERKKIRDRVNYALNPKAQENNKKWTKAWRAANPAKNRQLILKHRAIASDRRVLYQELKSKTPCKDCGIIYPHYVTDYDHIDPTNKRSTVSSLAGLSYSWDIVQEEIAKCELVCSNCHRTRTWKNKTLSTRYAK